MPCTRRALAPLVLLVGTVSVRGDTCLEPGTDNYYPLYGGRISGSCVRPPNFVCMDPEAANYGGPNAMSKCQPRAFIEGHSPSHRARSGRCPQWVQSRPRPLLTDTPPTLRPAPSFAAASATNNPVLAPWSCKYFLYACNDPTADNYVSAFATLA
eukprot:jgi/Chrpa1/14789/Chrysochromulina_OHIO_Genome00024581-RA